MKVCLTFDFEHPDQPHAIWQGEVTILDTLKARGVQATFFLQGKKVRSEPQNAARIAAEGHQIGSHGYWHASYPFLTPQGIVADLEQAQEVIVRETQVQPWPLFRYPYGQSSSQAAKELESRKYRSIGWNVDSVDYRPENDAQKVIANVLSGVKKQESAIVLMHTWTAGTVRGLDSMIVQLQEIGAEFGILDV